MILKKPSIYDELQMNEDFTPIEVGGHKGIILGIQEYKNEETGNTSLKVIVDTDKTDKQPSYFKDLFESDTRSEKKWSNQAIKYVSLKDDENCVKMLKAFITAVENSNSNFTYDWDKDIDQLKNKKVGLVFGLEEYQKQQGEIKVITKLNQFRSIDKIDNVKIPKVKLIDGSTIDYEEYKNKKNSSNVTSSNDVVEFDPSSDKLPF